MKIFLLKMAKRDPQFREKLIWKLSADNEMRAIETLLESEDYEVYWRDSYSGRGMFGRVSPLAFETDLNPRSPLGEKTRKTFNLTYDNMGGSWIYYRER